MATSPYAAVELSKELSLIQRNPARVRKSHSPPVSQRYRRPACNELASHSGDHREHRRSPEPPSSEQTVAVFDSTVGTPDSTDILPLR